MKRFTIIFLAVLSISLANAQTKLDRGISEIYNLSSKINYKLYRPENGTFRNKINLRFEFQRSRTP